MQKKKLYLFGLLGSILLLGWILVMYHTGKKNQANDPWVQVVEVQASTLPIEVHAIGTLTARSIEMTPEMAGHVEKIYFHDGDHVKAGQLLMQLDDATYKAQYDSALAKLTYSERDYHRKKLLGERGAIALQAIEQAEADLKEKRAQVQETKVLLDKTRLVAPFAGVLGQSKVNVGEYVTIGQSLVTLSYIHRLRIEYAVPEKMLSLLRLGQTVTMSSTAYPERVFSGKVVFISPMVNPDTRTISLYAEVNNDPPLLAAGMFMDVTHFLANKKDALMIPARSLVPVLGGEQIYKIINNRAYNVPVMIGARNKDQVQVIQGLKIGDTVVTDGQFKLKSGMTVHAQYGKHNERV